MEDNVKSRILKFLEYKKLNASQFSQLIGVSRNYVSSMSKSIQPDKLQSISVQFPELNIEWLLIGKGEMLRDDGNNNLKNIEDMEKFLEMLRMAMEQNRALISIIENLTHEPFEQRMVG